MSARDTRRNDTAIALLIVTVMVLSGFVANLYLFPTAGKQGLPGGGGLNSNCSPGVTQSYGYLCNTLSGSQRASIYGPGSNSILCTDYIYLDGTTPEDRSGIDGSITVGTPGQDMGTFPPFATMTANHQYCMEPSSTAYTFATGITPAAFDTMIGSGRGATSLSFTGSGNFITVSVNTFYIHDLTLIGNNGGSVQTAINCNGGPRLTMEYLDVHYFAAGNSYVAQLTNCTNSFFGNNHFWNNWGGIAIMTTSTNFKVINDYFSWGAATPGLELSVNGSATDGRVTANLFEGGTNRVLFAGNNNAMEANDYESNAGATDITLGGSNNAVIGNLFTNTIAFQSGIGTGNQLANNVNYDPVNKITNFVATGSKLAPWGSSATVVASTDYVISGVAQIVTSTGGTGVSITVKDGSGNTVTGLSGLATITAQSLPIGYKINFGPFSVAPTVTDFGN